MKTAFSLLCLSLLCLFPLFGAAQDVPLKGAFTLNQPVSVYNNWSAYDELSDNVKLTEELAMKQLDKILRLRKAGVIFDYYLIDAFWYDPDGGYRTFRKADWPNGPDRWLARCKENGIRPGLWVATNQLSLMNCIPEWKDSLNAAGNSLAMFEGGFLPHFMDSLQHWYDRGVRIFKFDFADFNSVPAAKKESISREEAYRLNVEAFRAALLAFRQKNPDAVLTAFNGFGGEQQDTVTPVRKTVDLHWLDLFDSLYPGDPRPSDVPTMNFWRSKDIYTDHMVRYYELNGFPLERIDNTGFMVGTTGTCYKRETAAWRGMLVLTLARGGWMNVYYGNLELLGEDDARFFAKAQKMFYGLQAFGQTITFGALPGTEKPYGFCSVGESGSVYTVVNPSQSIQSVTLPVLHRYQKPPEHGRILFTDAGFLPELQADRIALGPEQMAVIGYGEYAVDEYDLGIEKDVIIPVSIQPLETAFEPAGRNQIRATVTPAKEGDLRFILRQSQNGKAKRSSGGAPPNGTPLGQILILRAEQNGKNLPIQINYDKAIWSGLSWAAGEIRRGDFDPNTPIILIGESKEKEEMELKGEVYAVRYE